MAARGSHSSSTDLMELDTHMLEGTLSAEARAGLGPPSGLSLRSPIFSGFPLKIGDILYFRSNSPKNVPFYFDHTGTRIDQT